MSAVTIVNSHEKNVKIIFLWLYHYDVEKCHQNLNFVKMDTASYTGKNDGF